MAVGRRRPMLAFAAALGGFWLAPVAPLPAFLAVGPLAYDVLCQVAGRHPARIGLPVLADRSHAGRPDPRA
ncbi:hypothetical protein [Dactylosporangium sp. CA-139066]|uniref:hypothetical protein n=1 Tax=Dactylosporangium sp. CA-139066 TaxID=3239930 RepID=UPI003D8E3FB8